MTDVSGRITFVNDAPPDSSLLKRRAIGRITASSSGSEGLHARPLHTIARDACTAKFAIALAMDVLLGRHASPFLNADASRTIHRDPPRHHRAETWR